MSTFGRVPNGVLERKSRQIARMDAKLFIVVGEDVKKEAVLREMTRNAVISPACNKVTIHNHQ